MTTPYNPNLHPHSGKGAGGGEFTSTGHHGAKGHGQHATMHKPTDQLGYDAKGKHGAGYGHKSGDPAVKGLQTALNRLGVTDDSGKPLAVDGKYGPKTTAAVKKLQQRLGLEPTGVVTAGFVAKLSQVKSLHPQAKTVHRSAAEPYGDVHYADPGYQADGRKRYPLDTEAHVRAAWSYINQAGNASKYSAEQLANVKARIRAAAKKFGIQISDSQRSLETEGDGAVADAERRYTLLPVELRAAGDQPRIGGYAAVFNKFSRNLGGFVEVTTPTFFNKSRGDGWPDVRARYNHDDNMLLGTTGAGTLLLAVDNVGLDYEVIPPQTRADVTELVQRGDVRKSSYAFRCAPGGDDWGLSEQGYPLRQLVSGQLVDVAPLSKEPAYLDTTAAQRSLADQFDASAEEVRALAEANDLRRFFVRSDGPAHITTKPRIFGPSAAAALLARKSDPWE